MLVVIEMLYLTSHKPKGCTWFNKALENVYN